MYKRQQLMITSASNTRVKKVAALNQKAKERRQEGKYVVEGVKDVYKRQACVHAGY